MGIFEKIYLRNIEKDRKKQRRIRVAKKRVVDIVKDLVLPVIEENGFELEDIEFVKEGKEWFLRVYIDKDGGITLDDCQIVSEYLSDKLDEVDPIPHPYYLEVSSPGLDRPLKTERDFEKYKGRLVEVHLYEAVDGQKLIEGELMGLKENRISLKISEDKIIEIPREKVSQVRLSVIIE